MTVAELIEKLQKLPADLPMYIGDWNEQYAPDDSMGAGDGPTIMPPHDVKRQGIVLYTLPERVVIGQSAHRWHGQP